MYQLYDKKLTKEIMTNNIRPYFIMPDKSLYSTDSLSSEKIPNKIKPPTTNKIKKPNISIINHFLIINEK
jgi:hypothetical protein